MRTVLYLNDCICSSLEQLRSMISLNLIPDTPIYEDLLTLQRDGELAQWLFEGDSENERELAKKLDNLPKDNIPNGELMRRIWQIIMGSTQDLQKPSCSSYFELREIRCEANGIPIILENSLSMCFSGTVCMAFTPVSAVLDKHWAELMFTIVLKIKKVDNEFFVIRLVENDKDFGLVNSSYLWLKDKRAGELITVITAPYIVGEECNSLSLKANEETICEIKILKDIHKGTIIVGDTFFTMTEVEGGKFLMGNNYGDYSERPEHYVTLDNFFISETAVTQEIWEAVMHSNPSIFKGSKNPVENIYWNDCQVFIDKLNHMTNMKFRLPTEAEWEYAAKGGIESKHYLYSGSNTFEEIASRGNKTYPVATKKPNELGLYDMSGNVREWCQDWYDDRYYKVSPSKNPTGPLNSEMHVNRGGSWADGEAYCRVSYRGALSTKGKCHYIGFRIAL